LRRERNHINIQFGGCVYKKKRLEEKEPGDRREDN
jgi:hypothetical protein